MFLRNDPPSETSRKMGRGIVVTHMVVLVAIAVCLNLAVAVRLTFGGTSPELVWIQLGGIALLGFCVFGLVRVIRSTRAKTQHR